jgi:dihydropteroate synthase
MGAINVTMDSFSGDGLAGRPQRAMELALQMEADGADIIDIGAESTRPKGPVYGQGATFITVDEELARLLPPLELILSKVKLPVSVDTYKPLVGRHALEMGVSMINDVWGLKGNPDMLRLAADFGVPIVLMHNQANHEYYDLLPDIRDSIQAGVTRAMGEGVTQDNILVDPGIGFGKTADHNLEILKRLSELTSIGFPLLVGTSRKSTIGLVLDLPVNERLEGTASTVALSIAGGADMVRVHDVKEMARVSQMSDAIVRGWRPETWSRQ